MKKFLVLCLCFALCLPVTACSSKKETLHTDTLGTSIDTGKFMVDEQEFSFPAAMTDWTGHGWHVSNNYNNKDSFTLEPMIETTTFELYQDDGSQHYVEMKAYNDTNEDVSLDDGGITSYVRMKFSSKKDGMAVELPGGVTHKSTMDDVVGVYGEPAERDDDELRYTYETGGWICSVLFRFVDGKVIDVEYSLPDDNWGSVSTPEKCEQFVDDALRTSFYNDYERYVENRFDTAEGAVALYENEVEYYAQSLMYYLDVNYEVIDEEIIDGYCELAKKVFGKFKWDAPVFRTNDKSGTAVNGALVGDLELTLYPTDYLDIVLEPAQEVVDEFQAEHGGLDPNSLSDEEYLGLENEYAANMLEAISPKVDEISYRDPVVMTYEIDTYDSDGVIFTDDEWNEIDDILMDFSGYAE